MMHMVIGCSSSAPAPTSATAAASASTSDSDSSLAPSAALAPNPIRTVEAIFNDFRARRTGILLALTDGTLYFAIALFFSDLEEFYRLCDPDVTDYLGLFGNPNGSWKVKHPCAYVPLPEPTVGINFERVGLDRRVRLDFVAKHSDSWLLSVAFYQGSGLNRLEGADCSTWSMRFLLSLKL